MLNNAEKNAYSIQNQAPPVPEVRENSQNNRTKRSAANKTTDVNSNVNISDLPTDVQELVLDHIKTKNITNENALGKLKLNKTDVVQIGDLFSPKQKQILKNEFERTQKGDNN